MRRCASCLGPESEVAEPWTVLVELLDVLRRRLHMELAWLGQLKGDLLVLQVMSGDGDCFGVRPGMSIRQGSSLWEKSLSGEIPAVLPDVRADPRAARVTSATEFDIGSYAATPVFDAEGETYGMLGCLSREPSPGLDESDASFLRLLAGFLSQFVIDLRQQWDVRSGVWRQIRTLLDEGGPQVHFQPVVELSTGRVIGLEGLSRFPTALQGPKDLFAAAATVGLGPELEMAAIRNALRALPDIPAEVTLTVNASPATATGGLVDLVLSTGTPERVAVEITEHDYIGDDRGLLLVADILRGHGTHIAVDDVGSCYSGLEQLLHLRPEVIKMDYFITHGIDLDPARQAVAAGLTRIAQEIGGRVVAEGIETVAELEAVVATGIECGQGFLLGPPTPSTAAACRGNRLPHPVGAARTGWVA
ncbi:EAL domain-containing protein [Pseudofrankia sp. DC12]|uniref:sensor domain-containing phosphodiesterase n=1 Tax=Pseudofrankia sp. DC12 TaxID=683315 RepID=UPI0005F85D04|nr:EAL domain-containing protein [Pseudofrankia sp. DC12]